MFHKELEAWKKSIELVTKVYNLTKIFPEEEKFGLIINVKRQNIIMNISVKCGKNNYNSLNHVLTCSLNH